MGIKANGFGYWLGFALLAALLAACSSGPVRRVSEPAARLQQLTVGTDGSWTVQVRIENYSSIPMRFDRFELTLQAGGHEAGTLQASPALDIGPESADVVETRLMPSAAAKLAVADALAAGRGLGYQLTGKVVATPEESRKPRDFEVEYRSSLNPAPGLPGVLR
ncbi:LEA type 2 family protein [Marilutibacter chinensis]|uniref:LEA type 2 family protein n=1 Tax=Marilutibacter chinensis TaxID=2912247 RepID=A0ABS9HV42_9GAMM|nr:LEA type 2 family protein [Lysobacter chinensis]MCF7222766.1 LEA type 2 family protein [Lysobacter chinensis]